MFDQSKIAIKVHSVENECSGGSCDDDNDE